MYRLLINMHFGRRKFDVGKAMLSCALVASFCLSALTAATIAGTVRNLSTGRLAADDDVILLRLDQGMEEEAHTKTDSQGRFALNVRYPDKPHLVRVIHQAVTYDRRASVGDTLSIEIFDAAAKVQGVTGIAEIIRVGTKGNLLHVSDMYDIKNGSNPPRTQAGVQAFRFYVAAKAKIDSVIAAGPGGIGVLISAAPVRGQPGHYTVNFPLRPGDTKFAVNYDLPYDGHAAFHHKIAYPVQQLAIMLPPTMKFTSSHSGFHRLAAGSTDFQVQAVNHVKAGKVPGFEISGAGALPSLAQKTKSPPQSPSPAISSPAVPASGRSDSSAPGKRDSASQRLQSSSQWLMGVVTAFIFVACGFLVWRVRARRNVASAGTAVPQASQARSPRTLLEALKKELFQLETDRLRGAISGEDYVSTKRALEETIRRAVAKAG